ncbi:MAG: amino acid adenylation domain-containing protein, partial [Gammaproteobacteria bacterium]|nr:amino acid adenylation domain-containing protein [Gammaproteobacteria bacterium]
MNRIEKKMALLPLHPAQESIYFAQLLKPNSPTYNVGFYQAVTFDVASDVELLREAWRSLEQYIESLHTVLLPQTDGVPLQKVCPADTMFTEVVYCDFTNEKSPRESACIWMQQQMDKLLSYDDVKSERHQFAVLYLGKQQYYLFMRFHHLFNDGMGMLYAFDLLHQIYQCLKSGISVSWLSELPPYREAVLAELEYLKSSQYKKDKEYWTSFVSRKEKTCLPSFYPPVPSGEHTANYLDVALPEELSDAIKAFSKQHQTNPLSIIVATVNYYFAKTLNIIEPVLGVAVHGREDRKAIPVIGMHANEVPVSSPVKLSSDSSFEDLVLQAAQAIKESFKHKRFPSHHLARLYDNQAVNLHDIVIVYDAFSQHTRTAALSSNIGEYVFNKYDDQPLLVRLTDFFISQSLHLRLSYAYRYFSDREAELLIERLIQLMSVGIQKPKFPLASIPLLLDSEKKLVLTDWNQTQAAYPQAETLVSLFEQQVEKHPNATALIFEEESLTYAELNGCANAVAQGLRKQYQIHREAPLSTDTLIGLYLNRSIEMVVGILGVLKAGGAYVPLSPEYPQSRVVYILKDTQAPIVLCQSQYQARLSDWCIGDTEEPSIDPLILAVDAEPEWLGDDDNLPPMSGPRDLAYVIYTSGTTGQPKGVMVEHHNVVHLVTAQQKIFEIEQCDSGLLFADMAFDASVSDLFMNLLLGIRSVLCTEEERLDIAQLIKLAERHHIEWATFPPAVLAQMDTACWPALKTLVVAGETPSLETLRRFNDKGIRLFNVYGPTENTVSTSAHRYRANDTERCIGQPIANTQVYVLDEQLTPVPIGAVGELYIGGAGVARGYLNREDLTAERFITNPFASAKDREKGYTRLYKSGDLVRWVMDAQGAGQLEYRGRNDMQVKIRGYRIELGGIEAVLGAQRGVRQAVV